MFSNSHDNGSDGSKASESASIFSYESSDEEGYFSYSDLSPKYNEDSFDLDFGFKKLKITDNKNSQPVQYYKSGPIGPIFPFDAFSSLGKIKPEYFENIQLVPHNRTLYLTLNDYNLADTISYLNSRFSVLHKKYIQHLAIDLQLPPFLRSHEFRKIIEVLAQSFPSTRYLYLNFRESTTRKRTDRDLAFLSLHITKEMPDLKHFVLKFSKNDKISSEGFENFCKQIAKRSKRLEYLSLDFSQCEKIEDPCHKSLTHYMSTRLRHLKGLRLNICLDSDNEMKNVSLHQERFFKQLESLDLGVNQPVVPNMVEKFPKDSRQLSLYLNTDPDTLIRLDQLSSSYLQPIENLKSLNLHLLSLNISEEGAQALVETLNSKIKTLEHLKINFSSCLEAIQAFLEFIKCPENNQLKKLELGFDSFSSKNAGTSMFYDKNFKYEKKYKPKYRCECDTGSEDEEEGEELPLTDLPMKLFSTFNSNFLQHLKNLTYLGLRIEMIRIKDLQVKKLAACIAQDLPKLESLNVFFFMCPAITDESVEAFQDNFCAEDTLISLKTLALSFSNCHQISKQPIRLLRSSLKKRIPTIESTAVNFIDFVDYAKDIGYHSSDDEDNEWSNNMFPYGPEWKAIKAYPGANPEFDSNWKIVRREYLEAESSYYESDAWKSDDDMRACSNEDNEEM